MPSTIGVSAFGGDSLFGLFTKSIGENLSHFPIGPQLTDKFWCVSQRQHVRPRPYDTHGVAQQLEQGMW